MNLLEEKTSVTSRFIDLQLEKLRKSFTEEMCRKHLTFFRATGQVGTLLAGLLGLLFAFIIAIQNDSFVLFLLGIIWLLTMSIIDYISRRFSSVSDHLIQSTKSYLSSHSYIDAIALLVLTGSMAAFGFGVYAAIQTEDFGNFVKIGALSVWLFYIGLIALHSTSLLNIEIKEGLKAEEEGIGLLEFNAKSALFAVPFYFGPGIAFALLNILWAWAKSESTFSYLVGYSLPYFITIAIIAALPLIACIAFLILYTSFAAVKSLVRMASASGKNMHEE